MHSTAVWEMRISQQSKPFRGPPPCVNLLRCRTEKGSWMHIDRSSDLTASGNLPGKLFLKNIYWETTEDFILRITFRNCLYHCSIWTIMPSLEEREYGLGSLLEIMPLLMLVFPVSRQASFWTHDSYRIIALFKALGCCLTDVTWAIYCKSERFSLE